jgi:cell division inhibitor SepF
MANVFKNFLDSLKLNDDDYDDDYDDELDDYDFKAQERELKRAAKLEQKAAKQQRKDNDMSDTSSYESLVNSRKARTARGDRAASSNVVPIRSIAKGFEVSITKPTSFEDSQDVCDLLLSGRATVINLEGFDVDMAQRIMDFVSGCVYAINGRLHQISSYIFIVSPDSVDISGDYLDLLESNGFEVPTLNKEF